MLNRQKNLHMLSAIFIGIAGLLTQAQFGIVGCIAHGTFGSRLPLLDVATSSPIMSVSFCFQVCLLANTTFAAVYNGDSCMCGNTITNNGASGSPISIVNNCFNQCVGNPRDLCGTADSAMLYSKSSINVGQWTSAGCYTNSVANRALEVLSESSASNSVEFCTSACSELGFTIAGLESSNLCFCGNDLKSLDGISGRHADEGDCSAPCPGNSKQLCGGVNRLNIWANTS